MNWLLLTAAAAGCLLAVGPALLFFNNLRLYRPPPPPVAPKPGERGPAVSLLIPARNEASAIGACVEAALRSEGVDLEVIVLDDHSDDDTPGIVARIAAADSRLRLEPAPQLPAGWCGKQHACYALARLARHPVLAFIDADVRLTPDGLARGTAFLDASGAALVSGVPRQETGTLLERLLIPLIHFLLLSYLPIARMRRSVMPAYGAGCGQLFLTRREDWERAGGHAAIRRSLHDGVALPRAYRRAGLMTDLFDATGVATCRMYRSGREVLAGLAKNATEGMASPAAIVPWTVLLMVGQVMPAAMLLGLLAGDIGNSTEAGAAVLCAVAVVAAYAVRFTAAARFRQSTLGAALHPVGVLVLVAVQWVALLRRLSGRPSTWRGRAYDVSGGGGSAEGADAAGGAGPARTA